MSDESERGIHITSAHKQLEDEEFKQFARGVLIASGCPEDKLESMLSTLLTKRLYESVSSEIKLDLDPDKERRVGASLALGMPYNQVKKLHDDIMLEEDSKLDYQKRYKRFGDVVRDMVTGEMIPLRKLDPRIKFGMEIK